MPTNRDRDKAKKGIRARQAAIKTLIENHQQEFNTLHETNRLAVGLSRRSQGPDKATLETRLARAREQMMKWEEELRKAEEFEKAS